MLYFVGPARSTLNLNPSLIFLVSKSEKNQWGTKSNFTHSSLWNVCVCLYSGFFFFLFVLQIFCLCARSVNLEYAYGSVLVLVCSETDDAACSACYSVCVWQFMFAPFPLRKTAKSFLSHGSRNVQRVSNNRLLRGSLHCSVNLDLARSLLFFLTSSAISRTSPRYQPALLGRIWGSHTYKSRLVFSKNIYQFPRIALQYL